MNKGRVVLTGSALVAAFSGLMSCTEVPRSTPGGGWAGSVDTLASGRLVVTNLDRPAWPEGAEFELEELFRLGTLVDEGPELFGEVRAVELGPGGEVYVLDSQAYEIRVFESDGSFRLAFGGPGEGPGELGTPAGMTLDANENLWILDHGNGRYTAYDPRSGELHDERRRRVSFVSIPWPGRFDTMGHLLDPGLDRDGSQALLRTDTSFVPIDTLDLPLPDERNRIAFRRDGMMMMVVMDPFAPQPAWAPHPEGGLVSGEGGAYRLHRIGFGNDTTLTIVLVREPEVVTRAERDSALLAFAEMADRAGAAIPDRQPRVRETKPLHGALFVDREGRIWVRAWVAADGQAAWDLFSPSGRYMGQVAVPVRPSFVTPSVRDDRLAIAAEVDGVPTVVVYRMIGPGTSR